MLPTHKTNHTKFWSAMIPTESLSTLHLQKCDYCVPSTTSTSNIMGQASQYPMSANIRTRDQPPTLVAPIESQNLERWSSTKHKQHHNVIDDPPPSHYSETYSTNRLNTPLFMRFSQESSPKLLSKQRVTLWSPNTPNTLPREGNYIGTSDCLVIRQSTLFYCYLYCLYKVIA